MGEIVVIAKRLTSFLTEFVIHYLVYNLQPLIGRNKLINLVFLVDYTAYTLTNVPVTGLRYHKTKNGVYQRDLLRRLYELVARGVVVEIQLPKDFVYYSLVKPPTEAVHDALLQILDNVIGNYEKLSQEELAEVVKKIRFEFVK